MAGTILIVDDVAVNRIVLKVKLAAACYETLQAENGLAALQIARDAAPDIVLLDVMLPDIDGLEVCRRLKSDVTTHDIPVIMITAVSDADARVQALQAGADDFLTKPVDELLLLARLRSLMRTRETAEGLRLRDTTARDLGFAEPESEFVGPGIVALVAGCTETAMAWRRELAPYLQDRMVIMGREGALAEMVWTGALGAEIPDLFVIAADMAQSGDGLRLVSELRSRNGTRHAAICIVLGPASRDSSAMALDLGADDLLFSGSDPREMALRVATQLRRKRQADRLRASVRDGLRAAVIDPLTGLYNRRYAIPHLARIAERSGETGKWFAVMMLDIDRFKAVNDTYGHAGGDTVLVEVASRLRDNLRAVDLVARIGGEEFLVILPDTTLGQAHMAAERLCEVVHERPIILPNGARIEVTVSIGLAIGGGRGAASQFDVPSLIEQADHAMLSAKTDGRNRVIVSRTAAGQNIAVN